MSTISKGQQLANIVRRTYPDVYIVPGIGWCGPQWELAQALWITLHSERIG